MKNLTKLTALALTAAPGPDRLRQQCRHRARSGIRRREHRRGRVRRPVERDPGQGYHHGCDGGHMGTLDLPR